MWQCHQCGSALAEVVLTTNGTPGRQPGTTGTTFKQSFRFLLASNSDQILRLLVEAEAIPGNRTACRELAEELPTTPGTTLTTTTTLTATLTTMHQCWMPIYFYLFIFSLLPLEPGEKIIQLRPELEQLMYEQSRFEKENRKSFVGAVFFGREEKL